METLLPRRCRVLVAILALTGWSGAARAQPDGPVALVVNSDDPAFSWDRVQRSMAEALGTAVVATDDPAASGRRGLLTVSWRPSRHELAVTYEDARGVIGRSVPAPDDVAAGVAAAAFLAVNLARDQVADVLGHEAPAAKAAPPAPSPPPVAPRREPRIVAEDEPETAPPAPPPPAPRWTISLVGGVGAGWASGHGDVNADATVAPGVAPSGTVHLVPEVGYYLTPRLLLSLSARMEFVTGTTDRHLSMSDPGNSTLCGGDFVCEEPHNALAGFARATIFWGGATRDLRPYTSFALGVGQIRYPVTFQSVAACGPKGNAPCVDTITNGPFFTGPGGGLRYRLSQAFEVVAGLEILLGGPSFTPNADANVGAAVSF